MQRWITGLLGGAVATTAVFAAPAGLFLLLVVGMVLFSSYELAHLVRRWVPKRSLVMPLMLGVVAVTVPLSGAYGGLWRQPEDWPLVLSLLLVAPAMAVVALGMRTPIEELFLAAAALAFGVSYLSGAGISIFVLRQEDPWLLFLVMAIVFLGDSAAFLVGRSFGRHKLAPQTSPNKTWEGAIAGLSMSLLSCCVWSLWRLGRLDPWLLGLAVLTAVAAQLGDLIESALKRGAGVKDSGQLFPGHGGALDRFDALFLATPVFTLGTWLLEQWRGSGAG